MPVSRHARTKILNSNKSYGSNKLSRRIFIACETGTIVSEVVILSENQRLDQLAGNKYGDASLWWIIAAASGIGWGLQVPPGTLIRIPKNPNDVYSFI